MAKQQLAFEFIKHGEALTRNKDVQRCSNMIYFLDQNYRGAKKIILYKNTKSHDGETQQPR